MPSEEVEMIEEVKCSPINSNKNKDALDNCSYMEDTPPAKKLKQARLPFAILDSKSNSQKKRKLSGDASCCRSTKAPRNEDGKILLKKSTEALDSSVDDKINKQVEEEESICSSENENLPKLETPLKMVSEKSKAIMRNFICKPLQAKEEVQTSVQDEKDIDPNDSKNDGLSSEGNCSVIILDEDTANEIEESKDESDQPIDVSADITKESVEEGGTLSRLDSSIEEDLAENSSFRNDCEEIKQLSSDNCSTPIKEKDNESQDLLKKKKTKRRSIEEKKRIEAEKEQKKLEKERLKEERNKAKEQKLLESAKKRQEREAKLKEKQELKEKLQKEKNEKKDKLEKERLEKIRLKEEERKKKQELLEAKLEEKKKKELEKTLKDEEVHRIQAKTKLAFVNFFVKKDVTPSVSVNDEDGLFKPFQVRENMRLAPVCRVDLEVSMQSYLDESLINQTCTTLYLDRLRSGSYQSGKSKNTWPLSEKNDDENDIEIIENDCDESYTNNRQEQKHPRAKLLQFHENVRPPYWGTWQKTSKAVQPRKPFGKDTKFFDYEVDSDEEWEEEEPGESLSSTEDEKESEDEYEVDNDVFVPHGYLSEEEASEDEDMSPDTQKAKLKQKELEFEEERNKKFKQIKPSVIGCIWLQNEETGLNEIHKLLDTYKAVFLMPTPLITSCSTEAMSIKTNVDCDGSITMLEDNCAVPSPKTPKRPVPENALPFLIKLIHGNKKSRTVLMKEFLEFWRLHNLNLGKSKEENDLEMVSRMENESSPKEPSKKLISKRQLEMTIQKIAIWKRFPEPGPIYNKMCWYVHPEIREKYGLENITLPNQWKYVTNVDLGSPGLQQSSIGFVMNKIKTNSKESSPVSDEALLSQKTQKESETESSVNLLQNQSGENTFNIEKSKHDTYLEISPNTEVLNSSKPKPSIKHFFTKPKADIIVPAALETKTEPSGTGEKKECDDLEVNKNEDLVVIDYSQFQQEVKYTSLSEKKSPNEVDKIKNNKLGSEEEKLEGMGVKNQLSGSVEESERESQGTERKDKEHSTSDLNDKENQERKLPSEDSNNIEIVSASSKK